MKELGQCSRRTRRGLRGRHAEKEQSAKARNHSQVASALLPGEATRISRFAAKSRSACEWGGWGRISDDGPGQNNPDRSEDPWGRAARPLEWRCTTEPRSRLRVGSSDRATECAKDGGKPVVAKGMPGAGLSGTTTGKAPPERPALKPYWGKPAVRNFRGARGNGATASAKRARSWKRRTRPSANLKGHRAARLLDRPLLLLESNR